MTNGELFIRENPNIEFKLNGSCVWLYFDGVNHYTMPVSWWEQEISLFDKLRAEIENDWQLKKYPSSPFSCGLRRAIEIIDKYRNEVSE